LDVTEPTQAARAVGVALDRFGHLDVVVNNAGFAESAAFEDMPEDLFRQQVETDFFGAVNVSRAALPVLRAQRSGYLIQISSIVARMSGVPGLTAYQASKFAIEGFSESLASEVAPLGIRVVLVEPGAFRTEFISASAVSAHPDYSQTAGLQREQRERNAGRQRGDPERAAAVIASLPYWPNLPFRLLLGPDALERAQATAGRLLDEARTWAHVSVSTDLASTATSRRACPCLLRPSARSSSASALSRSPAGRDHPGGLPRCSGVPRGLRRERIGSPTGSFPPRRPAT
jgi:NAD(P)-dependent dehydrogenase (short-subunit alcohol dehydrogenase family)